MKKMIVLKLLTISGILLTLTSCAAKVKTTPLVENVNFSNMNNDSIPADTSKVVKTEEEWKKLLSPEEYYVARQKGTERPWSSPMEKIKDTGTFYCKACDNALFKSNAKFESGCGWPSFYEPISKNSMLYEVDKTHGMVRTEVMCGKCKSHLGHVFDDGPPPTGLRYCINGVVLKFEQAKTKK